MNTRNATPFTQCALILKTNSISTLNTVSDYPLSNSVGSVNSLRTQYTWNNINLQEILGDQYHQFDYFTLVFKGMQYGVGVGGFSGLSTAVRTNSIVASGPAWRGCTYDVATRRNTAEATINNIVFNTVASTYMTSHNAYIATFRKSPTFNFTITIKSSTGGEIIIPPISLYPQAIYFFDIVPSEFPEPKPYPQVY